MSNPNCPNCHGTGMEPLLFNASCGFCYPEEYEDEQRPEAAPEGGEDE